MLLAVIMAATMLAGCTGQNVLENKKTQKNGKISISMYLWDKSMFKELPPLAGGTVPGHRIHLLPEL